MAGSNQKQVPVDMLEAVAQSQHRNNQALKKLTKQSSDTNRLLESINRRLWAINILARIQLAGVALLLLAGILYLIVMLVVMLAPVG